jgi:hypothetical protein
MLSACFFAQIETVVSALGEIEVSFRRQRFSQRKCTSHYPYPFRAPNFFHQWLALLRLWTISVTNFLASPKSINVLGR